MKNNVTIPRPDERPDRLGQYVKGCLNTFVFGEFSSDFIRKSKLPEEFALVSVPLTPEDLASSGEGLKPDVIAENMVKVMGADPYFPFVKDYVKYIRTIFDKSIVRAITNIALTSFEKGDMEDAYIHARAALILEPEDCDCMFIYAVITQSMHVDSEDPEMIGRCKAEALEYFELIQAAFPDFAPSYYHLGYIYLNMGLYIKANLTWKEYLKLTEGTSTAEGNDDEEQNMRQEILERMESLVDPCRIEQGINEAVAGRYGSAIEVLEEYKEGDYGRYWSVHYYLGVSYANVGELDNALNAFKTVLKLNPAHIETLQALAAIYETQDDTVNADKYKRKLELVEESLGQDQYQ